MACNGAEALALARQHQPSVILLDLAMPVMDGFAFRAEQLLDPSLACIPVICISGRYDATEASRRLQIPDCFGKPVDLPALVSQVGKLSRRRL
jgi:CheY-like chemotaxis protein